MSNEAYSVYTDDIGNGVLTGPGLDDDKESDE